MNNKTNIAQLSLAVLAIIGVFALFFFGKTTPEAKKIAGDTNQMPAMEQQIVAFNVDSLRAEAVKQLSTDNAAEWNQLKSAKDLEPKVNYWSALDRNDIASTYKDELAQQKDTFASWNSAGDLSVRAYRESSDTTNMLYFVNQAVSAYSNALKKEDNTETKIKLAKLHTDITGQIMNGVMLLQSVVEKEPNHIQANYELGMLSIRSGQDDKAIARFETIINNDPSFIEAYLLKSQLLLKQAKKDEAISVLDNAIQHARSLKEKEALQQIRNNIINN